MRALVLSFMHPDIVPGGAQQVAYNLHLGLQRAGHRSFFTAFHDRLPPRLVSDATPIVKMPQRDNEYIVNVGGFDYERFISTSRWLLEAYIRFAKSIKPDVIFVHHFMLAGIDLLVALRKVFPTARFVLTTHEFLPICKRDGHLVRLNNQLCTSYTPFDCIGCFPNAEPKDFSVRYRMFHQLFDICDVVVAPSHFQGEIMAGHFAFGDRLAVIPNGSFDTISHEHNGLGRRERGETLAFFGQVLRDKGIGFLLQQLPSLLANRKQMNVHIWGGGLELNSPEFRDKVEQAVKHINENLGHNRVVLRGTYDNRRVLELMTGYDCVVFPSLWPETFSMVFSEALVAGCKIVAPSVGAFKERMAEAGGNAYLYALGDTLSFSVAINAALSTPYKPLSDTAGEDLTIDAMARHYLDVVEDRAPQLLATPEPPRMIDTIEPGPTVTRDGDVDRIDDDEDDDEGMMTLMVGDFELPFDTAVGEETLDEHEPEQSHQPPSPLIVRRTKPRSWDPANSEGTDRPNPFAERIPSVDPVIDLEATLSAPRTRKGNDALKSGSNKKRSRAS